MFAEGVDHVSRLSPSVLLSNEANFPRPLHLAFLLNFLAYFPCHPSPSTIPHKQITFDFKFHFH